MPAASSTQANSAQNVAQCSAHNVAAGELRGPDTALRPAQVERLALGLSTAFTNAGVRAGERVLVELDGTVAQFAALLALIDLDASIVIADAADLPCGVDLRRLADRASAGRLVAAGMTHPTADTDRTQLRFGRWLARPDALIGWRTVGRGRMQASLRSGPELLAGLDACARRAVAVQDTLLCLVPLTHVDTLLLVLGRWSGGRATVFPASGAPVAHALRDGVAAGATAVLASVSGCAALAATGTPELRAAARSIHTWYRASTTGLTSMSVPHGGAVAQAFAVTYGRPLHDVGKVTAAGDVLFDGPLTDLTDHSPAPALLRLMHAVRDDPATFDRIVDNLAGATDGADHSADRLLAAFDAELRRQSVVALAATA